MTEQLDMFAATLPEPPAREMRVANYMVSYQVPGYPSRLAVPFYADSDEEMARAVEASFVPGEFICGLMIYRPARRDEGCHAEYNDRRWRYLPAKTAEVQSWFRRTQK